MKHTPLDSYKQRATERILKQCLKDKKITQQEYQQAIARIEKINTLV
ncbi:hypothetical protein [Bacillus cereus group sp. TH152-1LC]|nr:hypothetical protein [Bacillus cereus group sp. TH152-1LC]MDA1675380.1 hypothetical protein [Bacillus cereus group sp. TH152-1LC]